MVCLLSLSVYRIPWRICWVKYSRVEVIFIQCPEYLALLAFKVSVEKSAVTLVGLPLYVICFFSLTTFNILCLFSVLVVLMIICCGGSLCGVLETSCTRMGLVFSRFGNFLWLFCWIY
jgi:hypothetical protein